MTAADQPDLTALREEAEYASTLNPSVRAMVVYPEKILAVLDRFDALAARNQALEEALREIADRHCATGWCDLRAEGRQTPDCRCQQFIARSVLAGVPADPKEPA